MGRLEKEEVKLEVFAAALLMNVTGGQTQVGHVIGLIDKQSGKCPLA